MWRGVLYGGGIFIETICCRDFLIEKALCVIEKALCGGELLIESLFVKGFPYWKNSCLWSGVLY